MVISTNCMVGLSDELVGSFVEVVVPTTIGRTTCMVHVNTCTCTCIFDSIWESVIALGLAHDCWLIVF